MKPLGVNWVFHRPGAGFLPASIARLPPALPVDLGATVGHCRRQSCGQRWRQRQEKEMALQGKSAIVTGGAAGIGRAIAERFVHDGVKVMIADREDERGAATARELGKLGDVRFHNADVGKRADIDALVAAAIDAFGQIDILVNNAGIVHAADFLDLKEEDFDRVLSVNLKGSFLAGQAVARHMVERVKAGNAPGAIVNMSSVNAVFAIANQVPYSVSKGGINQLTKVMALGLAPYGIRVNAIGPGSIMTDMLASVNADPAAKNRILSRTPLGRIGDPSEIAAIAAFLASDDASYITGQTIYADGGRLPLNYTVPVKE
jgi:NAD(P)-dependent dehydrogenase (short-subunit alcohol dehydrogenase family)